METLESPIFEESLDESPLWNESFPINLTGHELDALAFELRREGCQLGWGNLQEEEPGQ